MLIAFFVFIFFVLIHELGHFFAAKYYGVPVLTLSIGFGPRIFSKRIGNTVYALSLLPLGGYVRFKLKISEDELSETNKGKWFAPINADERELLKEFAKGPLSSELDFNLKRDFFVLIAGPLMNLALAYILIFLFIKGDFNEMRPSSLPYIVINEQGVAQRAGLKDEDLVTAVNGDAILNYHSLWKMLYDTGSSKIGITVKRHETGELITTTITPQKVVPGSTGYENFTWHYDHGLRPYMTKRTAPVDVAFWLSWEILGEQIVSFIKDLFLIEQQTEEHVPKLTDPISKPKIGNTEGLIGLFGMVDHTLKYSFSAFLFLSAYLNIVLGIFNLLPIPALDGGQILTSILYSINKDFVTPARVRALHITSLSLLLAYSVIILLGEALFIWPSST